MQRESPGRRGNWCPRHTSNAPASCAKAQAHFIPLHTRITSFRIRIDGQAADIEATASELQLLATVNATLTAKGLLLKSGTVVDAILIAAPSSTKNNSGERDPEMDQTKKGNQWHLGMKAYIGVDGDSGLAYTAIGTATNVNGRDAGCFSGAWRGDGLVRRCGYEGVAKR